MLNWISESGGVFVVQLKRFSQITFSSADPLAAFEGLFVASMFSTLFWSLLIFALVHR
jgi:hypothetical protein